MILLSKERETEWIKGIVGFQEIFITDQLRAVSMSLKCNQALGLCVSPAMFICRREN